MLEAIGEAPLRAAIRDGKARAAEYVRTSGWDESKFVYPCGFANLLIRCRKNARFAKVLIPEGFKWDDYNKSYYHGAYSWTNTQSMDHKEAILRAFQTALQEAGIPSRVETRMD